MSVEQTSSEEDKTPTLPRGRFLRSLSLPAITRIALFGVLLYALLLMRRPCAEGVGRFVTGFDSQPDAGAQANPYEGFEVMTADETLKRLENWPDNPARVEDAGAEATDNSLEAADGDAG